MIVRVTISGMALPTPKGTGLLDIDPTELQESAGMTRWPMLATTIDISVEVGLAAPMQKGPS